MKSYLSGLFWVASLLILPLLLLVALVSGQPAAAPHTLLRMSSGLFAYTWLLAGLFLTSKPKWLDKTSSTQAQVSLFLASLPLSLGHAGTTTELGLASLSGQFALIGLLATSLYSLMFWVGQRLNLWQPSPLLMTWLHRLNALICGLIFIHVQLIDSLRHNLLFMVPFYGLTGLAFFAFLTRKREQATRTAQLQTARENRS